MEYFFVNDNFIREIKNNVVDKIFENLNQNDKSILSNYLILLIDTICIKFNFDKNQTDLYEHQFRQNNYRDSIGLLLMILPFIEDESGIKKKKLKSFNELYFVKKDNINYDINKEEPKYEFTNLQYGRVIRESRGNTKYAREIKFSEEHLKHNFILLLDTIQIITNKLYINWINIRPVDDNSYHLLKSYRQTSDAIRNNKLIEWDPLTIFEEKTNPKFKQGRYYGGMAAGDIYNIISNNLFHSIKDIKWIIYDVYINNKPIKFSFILNSILNIENCINQKEWQKLNQDSRDIFTNQWNNLLSSFNSGTSFANIPQDNISYILRVIVIFFNTKFKRINELKENKEYVPLPTRTQLKEFENLEEEDFKSNLDIDNFIYNTAKSIRSEYIYEYICDSFRLFDNTWYKKFYIINEKGNKILDPYKQSHIRERSSDVHSDITVKNVYNYAKSLISYTDKNNKYVQYPKQWKSLPRYDKEIILKRLNWKDDANVTSWFNIMRYLTQRVELNKITALKRNIEIHNIIKNDLLAEIVFSCLATLGLLSKFTPDKELTDLNNLPKDVNERIPTILERLKQKLIQNPEYRESIENSNYFLNNELFKDIVVNPKEYPNESKKYIDLLVDIKLKMGNWMTTYAMDWISQISFFHHYLNNRIIYLTGATGVGKSTQAPKLLLYSLKMLDYKNTGRIACTQPRTRPTEDNANRISYEMGVPIEEPNPPAKEETIETENYYIQYQHKIKKHVSSQPTLILKIMTDGTLYQQLKNPVLKRLSGENYTINNVYDIIIVDEAHEHNYNMDLILTKMKYVTYYNNDIKLVIISATLEDDEPIYRRYYRTINDNRMFPFNFYLEDHKLDRINVDRRIHISPPGETTQFKIEDNYIPDGDPVEIIRNITSTSTKDGDILLFQPGRKEISEAVSALNKITPSDTIALPYYGELSQTDKNFIEKINKESLSELIIPKSIPFETHSNYKGAEKVPKGTYKRFILVATPIAEASITISSLTYVVDTGFQKNNVFDYYLRDEKLKTTLISESSRIQRRGRVGRVANGEVYYIYEQHAMENNKRQYGISISNLYEILYDLLQDNPKEDPFFSKTNDPNFIENLLNKKDIDINSYPDGLDSFVKNQYFIKDNFIRYFGNNDHYDYINDESPYLYYKTGFSKTTLEDSTGNFYIIHPDELCLFRNILGFIISIGIGSDCQLELLNGEIYSKKIQTFWNMLEEKLFLISDNNFVYKTEFGINLFTLKKLLDIDEFSINYLISYVYGMIYKVDDQILKLISMYSIIKSVKNIVKTTSKDGKIRPMLVEAERLYSNCKGDSYNILKICNEFELFYNQLKRFDKELKFNDKIDTKFNDKIEEWCDKRWINSNKIKSYYKNHLNLLNKLYKYKKKILDIERDIIKISYVNLDWFLTHTPKFIEITDEYEKIVVCLMEGFSFNIVRHISIINNYYFYISILNPNLDGVYKIAKLKKPLGKIKGKITNDTFIKDSCISNYILYLAKQDQDISILENISPKLISEVLPHIINNIDTTLYNNFNQKQYIQNFIKQLKYDKNIKPPIEIDLINKYINIINQIRTDLYNNYDFKQLEKVTVIDDDPTRKTIITNKIQAKLNKQRGGDIKEVNKIDNKYIRLLTKILNN